MKTINLTSLKDSEIKYTIQNFPDGQKNVVLDPTFKYKALLVEYEDPTLNDLDLPYYYYPIQIKARLNNMEDFGLIACTVASLRELGVEEIHLYVPYFMGARSDRKFEEGGNWYLRDVICPMINALNFKSVEVLDPHSYVLGNLIKGFKSINNEELVKWAICQIYDYDSHEADDNMIFVSPDAGASHKIYKLAERLDYRNDIITCSKERAADGKLTKTVVPDFDLDKDVVIIDDIFDFGGTFKNIGGIMNDMGHKGKKYLIVTHAIQDKGIEDAFKWFDCIFTTNSYKDRDGDYYKKLKVLNIF